MFEILHALAKFAVRWNIFKASRNPIWLVKYLWPCNISAIHWDLVDSRLDLIANDLEMLIPFFTLGSSVPLLLY
jgi:hypothetical protein